ANNDGWDLDRFSRCWNAHELSAVRSRAHTAPHNLVVIGDHVLDRKVEIGKGCPEPADEVQYSLRTGAEDRGQFRPRVGGRKDMGLPVDIALVPSLFDPRPYGCFVLLCRHLICPYLKVVVIRRPRRVLLWMVRAPRNKRFGRPALYAASARSIRHDDGVASS